MRFLAAREHSRAELERKLAPHGGDDPGEIARVLDALEARGFLSQARYVESVLHRRAARLGSARIRQELQAKGVDAEAVREAMSSLKGSELERAREVWSRKFPGAPVDARARAAQMRFLLMRGFPSEVVRRVVPAADADPSAADDPPAED